MANITNTWVGYITRTYQQIKDSVLTSMQGRVPEITDHTDGNIFVKMLDIWAGIAEMLGYYIDNWAREAHISTCRLYSSAVKLAKIVDYRVKGRVAATANVTFTIDAPAPSAVSIPAGTEVTTDDGLRFFTTINSSIAIGDTVVTIPVKQSVSIVNAALGLSSGAENEEIIVADDVEDNSLTFFVNTLAWNNKTTFGFSLPTDKDYIQTVNEDQHGIVRVGDGVNGFLLTAGDVLTANYGQTEGETGNVPAGFIKNIVGAITLPSGVSLISCTNVDAAAGGSSIETLPQLKRRIPLATRTLLRMVTRKDYKDVTEVAAGVNKAGVGFECGKSVDIYIVPDGGGIASGSLITSTQTWVEDKRMLTTKVTIKAAGETHLLLEIDVRARPQYQNSVVRDAVKEILKTFISYLNQEIGGTVQLSDIYENVENYAGVEYSNVTVMTPVPYGRPLGGTAHILLWTKVIKPASVSTIQWSITMISPTSYQLVKAGNYIGTYTVGVVNVQPEINFTVNAGGYIKNDSWEFFTYAYFGTFVSQEPSLPVSIDGDLTINVTGGL